MEFYNTFKNIITAVRDYYKLISNLEEVLGGVELMNFHDLPTVVCEELEKATGVRWTDDIWEAVNLPDTDYSVEDMWEKIIKLKKESGSDD